MTITKQRDYNNQILTLYLIRSLHSNMENAGWWLLTGGEVIMNNIGEE